MLVLLCGLPSPVFSATDQSDNGATVVEARGTVLKELLIDRKKQTRSQPEPVKINEVLPEGTLVTTGKRSWAQLRWRHVTVRCWADSAFAITPGLRTVHMQRGEILFDLYKKRREKSAETIWTPYCHARFRSTTAIVQDVGGFATLVTPLEGTPSLSDNDNSKNAIKLQMGGTTACAKPGLNDTQKAELEEALGRMGVKQRKIEGRHRFNNAELVIYQIDDPCALSNHPLMGKRFPALQNQQFVNESLKKLRLGQTKIDKYFEVMPDGDDAP